MQSFRTDQEKMYSKIKKLEKKLDAAYESSETFENGFNSFQQKFETLKEDFSFTMDNEPRAMILRYDEHIYGHFNLLHQY